MTRTDRTDDMDPLWTLSAAALCRRYADGTASPVAAARSCLERADVVNPALNALIAVDPDGAERAAVASEARWRSGAPLSPLDGVPVTIKDSLNVAGFETCWGSRLYAGRRADEDETPARRLRAAGAVILAKTTMCDWAAGFSSLSSLSGNTRHPIDPSRDPGGSSGGSGTSVAAGLALAAIGGDTGGSIRLPSSFCGLVGVRVTPGRISRDGMSALVKTFDTPGPMCNTVEDAARIWETFRVNDWNLFNEI